MFVIIVIFSKKYFMVFDKLKFIKSKLYLYLFVELYLILQKVNSITQLSKYVFKFYKQPNL